MTHTANGARAGANAALVQLRCDGPQRTLLWYRVMVSKRNQWKALRLLANAGVGSTMPALVRRGCTVDELQRLVRDGLVSAEPIQVQGKRPTPADFYLRVSDAGRKALARHERRKGSVRLALLLFVIGLLAGVCFAAFFSRS